MPFHYMFSEIAICLASGWGAGRLFRDRQAIGAFGVGLFALAATIGIVRIATGADALLAPAHRFASQAGGIFALALIVSQIAKNRGWTPSLWTILACASAAAAPAALAGPVLGAFIFLALLAFGTFLLATNSHSKRRVPAAIWFASMAPNILLVRQSPILDPAVSWHAYHLITALWLIAIVAALRPSSRGHG
ncbi:MAG: hypothetical protein ABL932_01320 [Terricaulis sp.]